LTLLQQQWIILCILYQTAGIKEVLSTAKLFTSPRHTKPQWTHHGQTFNNINILNHAIVYYMLCAYILQQFKCARSTAITATAARWPWSPAIFAKLTSPSGGNVRVLKRSKFTILYHQYINNILILSCEYILTRYCSK